MTVPRPAAPDDPAGLRAGGRGGPRAEWWTRTAVIIGAAALLRLIALLVFEGDLHDGAYRTQVAAGWLFDGEPIFGRTMWPEGNYLLPAAALAIWNDPYWSVRVLYALIALANIWIVARVGASAFDRRAGAVAAWVLALLPYHVYVSANGGMSELPYTSLLLAALWCVLAYRRRPSAWLAAAAGLALGASTMFRIDGVVWGLPLAASFVLLRDVGKAISVRTARDLAIFGTLGLLFLGALFVQWSRLYDSPWFILDEAKGNTLQFFGDGGHARWPAWLYQTYAVLFWPASSFLLLTPVVAAVAWIGALGEARRAPRRSLPLLLGLGTLFAWLAYAAFRHSILAQFRYAFIAAVLLALFVAPGARALASRVPPLRTRVLAAACGVGALLWQAGVADVTWHDRGVLSRQLGTLGFIRPGQFASRALLRFVRDSATPGAPVTVTPHVLGSPYLSMYMAPLLESGALVAQQYYIPGGQLVHTRASLTAELREKLSRTAWLVTSESPRELGLQDGLAREVVAPTCVRGVYSWEGTVLRPERRWERMRLWRVVPPGGAARDAGARPPDC